MPEEMPNIENESHITPSEGIQKEAPKPFQPSWIMEREDEFSGMNSRLQLRARQIHKSPESIVTSGLLRNHFRGIQGEVRRREVPEDEANVLSAKIAARIEELDSQPKARRGVPKVRTESSVERVLGDLSVQLGDLVKVLQQAGELRQVAGTAGQPITAAESQTAELRDIFGRLDPDKEKARWIDVEHSQEFYTRFTPNMEPHFYTRLEETAERAEWDARWKLARAAFWKKIYSAFPEKLAENQDLIELTTEQMEMLYRLPGVKNALEWYASAIVRGDKHAPDPENPRELLRRKDGKPRTILDCGSGEHLEQFRKAMRDSLNGENDWDKMKRLRGSPISRNLTELEKKSADAIAWNWIWCSNLVESIDSRYSAIDINNTRYKGERRHGGLAPALCSDDLRAVFHPQEKFEDKCRNGQEWGNFGKWGLTQLRRIEGSFSQIEDVVFKPARRLENFWSARPGRDVVDEEEKDVIVVAVPECYPITSMKSFWETYKDEREVNAKKDKKTLLERLMKGEEINWESVQSDPWKTNYLTIRLRKSVGLFDVFTKESKEGWARSLLDIYTRLRTYVGKDHEGKYKDSVLKDYYESLGYSETEAGRLAGIHFHNLKVWAVYAVQGGVGRPQDKGVTDPYSRSRLEASHRWNRSTHEAILRKPWTGYLEDNGLFKKESLVIESIE